MLMLEQIREMPALLLLAFQQRWQNIKNVKTINQASALKGVAHSALRTQSRAPDLVWW